jgi:hypothetical protein
MLDELVREHPYSPIAHVLKVKGRKTFNKPDFQDCLHLASTYVYDRSILKSILEGQEADRKIDPTPETNQSKNTSQVVEETPDFSWINKEDDEDVFIDEIPDANHANQPDQEIKAEKEEKPAPLTTGEETAPVRKQEEAQLPSNPEKKAETGAAKAESKDKPTTELRTDEPTKKVPENPLHQEIEAGSIHAELMKNLNQLQENKQQLNEQSDDNGDTKNRREQIEIIDNFIKNSPVLSKPNLSAESEGVSQDDLSKASATLNEELVSENLAKIYLKQGKAKDAEKIYRKLIRKFPQKKPYFADQIEKIKKK